MTAKGTPGSGDCPDRDGGERIPVQTGGAPELSFPWAAPSWVKPGTAAENARFLAGRVPEIGLCMFEAESSARMPETELPRGLADLPLRWHAHLPSDLPGQRDLAAGAGAALAQGARAAELALAAWRRAAFLHPRLGVLHLPAPGGEGGSRAAWLEAFFRVWRSAGENPRDIALENVRGAPFGLPGAPEGADEAALCLDMAHTLAYGQEGDSMRPDILARVRLLHWSAPGPAGPDGTPRDRHLPLTGLTPVQKDWLRRVWARRALPLLPADAAHLVEVFDWEGILLSLPELGRILGRA